MHALQYNKQYKQVTSPRNAPTLDPHHRVSCEHHAQLLCVCQGSDVLLLEWQSLYLLGHPPASVVNEMKTYKEEMNINYSIFVLFQRNYFLNGHVPFRGEGRDSVS